MADGFHGDSKKEAYRLIEKIGVGSQGAVWKAVPRGSESGQDFVAIKVLYAHGRDDDFIRRVRRQARILESLDHPHIVRYKDFLVWEEAGMHGSMPCLVTEYLDGQDLKSRLNDGDHHGLPWEETRIVSEACLDALVYARSRGVTHCDIKPSNVYLCRNGAIKLIDFGISRRERGDETATSTEGGGLKGTFDYMAPDFALINDFRPDEQSDIFSFGVCFYQMATGCLPFGPLGENPTQGYYKRWMSAEPRTPDLRNPAARNLVQILPDFRPFLSRCLAIRRDQRFKTFEEVSSEFRRMTRLVYDAPEGRKYECVRVIGQGGFGIVYEALETPGNQPVSLKLLIENKCARRFEHEARILQQHGHANVVGYRGFFRIESMAGSSWALVMELLPGMPESTLWSRIRAAPNGAPPSDILDLFDGYLAALEHLHGREIYHRDLKPSNLYAPVGASRAPCLLDFGIAKDPDRDTLTSGQIPGTPDYMPPEFATLGASRRHGAARARTRGSPQSDIYSLTVCMHEALTGQLPYPKLPKDQGSAWAEFFRRSSRLSPPPCEHDVFRQIPQLHMVIRRGLAADPERRYPTAAALRAALRAIRESMESHLDHAATKTAETHSPVDSRGQLIFSDEATGAWYEVLKEIGSGGFGVVYEALKQPSGERVALKVLTKTDSKRHLSEEARLLKKLQRQDPNIVQYRGFFEDTSLGQPRHVLVMELLPGMPERSLAGRLRLGAPDIHELWYWFGAYLEGLERLHKRGILHRDIKPSNLYAPGPSDGRLPCILDLGIAVDLDPERADVTGHGAERAGTWDYMAPELLNPGSRVGISQRSDLYSISICLYKSLTGELPFPRIENEEDVRRRSRLPGPAFNHPIFSTYPGLADLLRLGLDGHPRRRPASARKYREALEQAIHGKAAAAETHVAPPTKTATVFRPPVGWKQVRHAAAALLVVGATAAAAWGLNAWDLRQGGKIDQEMVALGPARMEPGWARRFMGVERQVELQRFLFHRRWMERKAQVMGLRKAFVEVWLAGANALEGSLRNGNQDITDAERHLNLMRDLDATVAEEWDRRLKYSAAVHDLRMMKEQRPKDHDSANSWAEYKARFETYKKTCKDILSRLALERDYTDINAMIKNREVELIRGDALASLERIRIPADSDSDGDWLASMEAFKKWEATHQNLSVDTSERENKYQTWANSRITRMAQATSSNYQNLNIPAGDDHYACFTNLMARLPNDYLPSDIRAVDSQLRELRTRTSGRLAENEKARRDNARNRLGTLASVSGFVQWAEEFKDQKSLHGPYAKRLMEYLDEQLREDPLESRMARLSALNEMGRQGVALMDILSAEARNDFRKRLDALNNERDLAIVDLHNNSGVNISVAGQVLPPGKSVRLRSKPVLISGAIEVKGYKPIAIGPFTPGGGYEQRIANDQLAPVPVRVEILCDAEEDKPAGPDGAEWIKEGNTWAAEIMPPQKIRIARRRPDYEPQVCDVDVTVGQNTLQMENRAWVAKARLKELNDAEKADLKSQGDYFKDKIVRFEAPENQRRYEQLRLGWLSKKRDALYRAMDEAERQIAVQRESCFVIDPESGGFSNERRMRISGFEEHSLTQEISDALPTEEKARLARIQAWENYWPDNTTSLIATLKELPTKGGIQHEWSRLEVALLSDRRTLCSEPNDPSVKSEWYRWKAYLEFNRDKLSVLGCMKEIKTGLSYSDVKLAVFAWKSLLGGQEQTIRAVINTPEYERTRADACKKVRDNTQYLEEALALFPVDQKKADEIRRWMEGAEPVYDRIMTRKLRDSSLAIASLLDSRASPPGGAMVIRDHATESRDSSGAGSTAVGGAALMLPVVRGVRRRRARVARVRGRRGSAMVEFVMILGGVVVPVLAILIPEFNGRGFGLLSALRHFCARLMVVIGVPFL